MSVMNLCNIGHSFVYELEKLIRIFLPFEKIKMLDSEEEDIRYAVASREISGDNCLLFVKLSIDGVTISKSEEISASSEDFEKLCERRLAVLLFECFVELTDYKPEWGILTGIRPAKLFSLNKGMLKEGFDADIAVFDENINIEKVFVGGNCVFEK